MNFKNHEDIIRESYVLYHKENPTSIDDVFKIHIENEKFDESYFIRTILLLIHQKGVVKKIDGGKTIEESIGMRVELNNIYKNCYIENITKVLFGDVITNMFLSQEGELFNYEGSMDMYASVFEEYRKTNSMKIKKYINSMYGVLMSKSPDSYLLPIISPRSIVLKLNNFLLRVEQEFGGHHVYTDSDSIYFCRFHEISTRFSAFVDEYISNHVDYKYLSYSIDGYPNGSIFTGKKKFIINGYRVKGIKVITDENSQYGKLLNPM